MCFAPQRRAKSGPTMVCFVHFDFEMCFAPQLRALFRHLNFQKWSDTEVFCTFSLRNVLRATTACTFSTSQLPKVLRDPGALYLFTWKCASRHNGVQLFISHLASWLRTRRFSEPTFRPSGATNHWKNTVFRDFPTFSRICIFFLLTNSLLLFSLLIFLFSLPLPYSAFHLSILSEVWLLNFLRSTYTVQICWWTAKSIDIDILCGLNINENRVIERRNAGKQTLDKGWKTRQRRKEKKEPTKAKENMAEEERTLNRTKRDEGNQQLTRTNRRNRRGGGREGLW